MEHTERRKSRSFGGTDEFLPLFGKDGGRAVDDRMERGGRLRAGLLPLLW